MLCPHALLTIGEEELVLTLLLSAAPLPSLPLPPPSQCSRCLCSAALAAAPASLINKGRGDDALTMSATPISRAPIDNASASRALVNEDADTTIKSDEEEGVGGGGEGEGGGQRWRQQRGRR